MKSLNLLCHFDDKLCYKHIAILLLFFIANLGNSQTYPEQVTVTSVDWESYTVPNTTPGYMQPFTDPLTGNTVTRISDESVFGCDCSQLRHIYAKKQPWNSDGTKIMTGGWPAKILDGNTYEVVSTTYCRSLWSNTNPDMTYDSHLNRLYRRNIVTQNEVILKTFSGYTTVSIGEGEGNLSSDDRYVALIATSGSQKTILVYDITNDEIIGTKSLGTANIDWVSVSQSGEYVVMSGYSDGSGPLQGIKAYDKFMNNEVHLYSGRPHGDIGYDAQGNEVYVGYQGISGFSLSYARLDNGQKQGLFPFTGATGDRGLWGGHVSARNLDRPGWAYVSDQGHPSDINRHEATREIFAIKLDASQTIERFAKHNSNLNVNNSYRHQAHAVPNRDGTKVIFASNWDRSTFESNSNGVLWVVEAPQVAGSQVSISSDTETLCEGESTTLTASGADSYVWNTGETSTSLEILPNTTTTYTVTGTHSDGSTTQDEITITVNQIPIADAGSDIETCLGTEVTLTASGGTSYLWSTGATSASINVNPNNTTTYIVEVFENACSSIDEIIVTVNVVADVDAGADQTIFEGESALLTATGADSYLWSTGETTQTITVNPMLDTSYLVTGTTNNCETTDTVTVFLLDDSVNANAGVDTEICIGESVTLTATGGTTYLWNTGETTASIEVSPTEITTYTVTAYSPSGTNFEDDSVIVTVNDIPVANAGEDFEICFGNSATLTASGGSSYLWNTGETTASITVNPTETTIYTVEAFENNCSSIDQAQVVVNQLPGTNAGSNVMITEGESTTLTASGADAYLWNTGETTTSITVSPTNTTTYTVVGTNSNGCEFSDDVIVSVDAEVVTANAGTNVAICLGDTTTLTATGGESYLWNTGETTASISVNPNQTTSYTVTAFNAAQTASDDDSVTVTVNDLPATNAGNDASIIVGESTILTATGADSYVWNTGETTISITVSPTNTTTYSVIGANSNGCESSDDVIVSVGTETVNANAGNNVAICNGESTVLTATGGSSYLWNTGETTASITVNPNQTTSYTVTAFNAEATVSDNDSVTVTVSNLPETNAGNNVSITEGDTTTLTATGADAYIWNTGETTASIVVSPTSTTTYSVTGNSNGCESIADVIVSVQTENVNANAGANVTICNGESTILTASGGASYLWSTGETAPTIEVSPVTTTAYTVTAFSANGSVSDDDSVTVTVNEVPVADAGNDIVICFGNETTLSASGGETYLWSTGETTQNITINPNNTTTYSVEVFVNNCSSSDDVIVTVNDLPETNAGNDITIIEGDVTTLTATGAESFVWNTGETTSNISVNPTITTTYTVTGTTNGCESLDSIIVTVVPYEASAGANQTICQGYETTLTASEGDSYLWSTGETTQSITVNPTSTHTYTVTVFEGNYQADAEVEVGVNPNPNVVITNGNDVMILEGEFITLSASGANTYSWNNGATQPNIAVSPSITTTYEVTGFINDCEDTTAIIVNVLETVQADAGEDLIICNEEIVTLTANGGDDYLWSNGETTQSIEVSPDVDTEYSVLVYNALDSDEDTVMVFVEECSTVEFPVESETFDFVIYQDPTTDILNVKIDGLQSVIAKGYSIYDLSGKVIYTETFNSSDMEELSQMTRELDVSAYSRGVYIVRLQYDDTSVIKKIPIR